MDKSNKVLHRERAEVEITLEGEKVDGFAEVFLALSPVPHVRIEASTLNLSHSFKALHGAFRSLGKAEPPPRAIHFKSLATSTNVQVSKASAGEAAKLIAIPTDTPLEWCGEEPLASASAYILNYWDFYAWETDPQEAPGVYLNCIQILTEEWDIKVTFRADTKEVTSRLHEFGGFGITHECWICRKKGEKFTVSAAKELFEALTYFLSFTRGFWCGLCLPTGYNDEGARVWEYWNVPPVTSHTAVDTWFDFHHGQMLREAFPGFWTKWQEEIWNINLRKAIFWYLGSNNEQAGLDGSLILSHTALELLAWVSLVLDRKTLSKSQFEKRSTADNNAILLNELDIPAAISAHELPQLQNFVTLEQWPDGVESITNFRNKLIHPDAQTKNPITVPTKWDAWRLSQWFVELCLLRIIGYKGEFSNRLLLRKNAGEVEPVPWAK